MDGLKLPYFLKDLLVMSKKIVCLSIVHSLNIKNSLFYALKKLKKCLILRA